jgi:uncharacterized protein (UPF0332 family)
MSVTPRELLAAARALPETDEASRRAIVNRVYYAAFHAAYEFHASLPVPGSVGNASGEHAQLIAQLSKPNVNTGHPTHLASRRIGVILGSLLALRVKADYRPNETVTENDVVSAWLKAEDIFKQCYPTRAEKTNTAP